MSSSFESSHGRGGAGNFTADRTQYVDGEVVRLGAEGSHGDGAYSAGRGGAGNISDVGTVAGQRRDQDRVPDEALRLSQDKVDFHTGRGGAGNEHSSLDSERRPMVRSGQQQRGEAAISLADKLKDKLFSAFRR
ncbi:GTP1/OBG domain-containing protein [Ophiocordyceps camponoti-floridani]|uniref:GTP1/OBG domain-containing protein n=1 Tax=Ophiocordyceps camponoti-floridani TaxID=2030778 RepID=A0A8H4Q705_9HYPO|nr:GTP1/OBG domain-containing protein [Ophiocordyceps camponoti-floridani]